MGESCCSFCKKPIFLQILVLLVIIVLSAIGGVVFNEFEEEASKERWINHQSFIINCTLSHLDNNSYSDNEEKSMAIFQQCINDSLPKRHWSTLGGSVFSFASITTLGLGSLQVMTQNGRIFYIIFCLIGLPLGLLLLANIGQFMQDGAGKLKEKLDKWEKERRERKKKKEREAQMENGLIQEHENESQIEDEEEYEMSGLVLLLIFALYVGAGVAALMIFKNKSLVDGIYFNFRGFTAIDLDEMVSVRFSLFFPVGILYVMGGLALSSLAIEILSRLLRKMHHWNKTPTYCGRKKIWFGGKRVTVKNLSRVLGKQWGVAKEKVENIDDILDALVQYQVDVQEGKAEPIPYPEVIPPISNGENAHILSPYVVPFVPTEKVSGPETITFIDDHDDD